MIWLNYELFDHLAVIQDTVFLFHKNFPHLKAFYEINSFHQFFHAEWANMHKSFPQQKQKFWMDF